MKKIFLTILFLCLIMFCYQKFESKIEKHLEKPKPDTLQVIQKRDKIIIGVREDTEPFGYRDENGNIVGFDADVAKMVAKYILGSEDKLVLVPVTAQNRIRKLTSGEVDILIATMSITWQRWQLVDFTKPYFMAGQAIMTKKSNPAMGLKGLHDKKFIVVYGSTAEENLRKNSPDIKTVGYKTYKEALQALKEDKADCIYADDTILYGLAAKDDSVKILPVRYSEEPYAIATRKGEAPILIEKLDYVIDNLEKKKYLEALKVKWKVKK